MYKVSVIIPIYNAEKFIERCIASIINQTMDFNEIEVILIDDNSSDNSKDIIKQYANRYKNIKPIYLETNHGGPSIPRNKGIEIASAEYIMFIDNDDEYNPEICETLYNYITSHDVDCVACRSCRVKPNGEIIIEHFSLPPHLIKDEIYFENEEVLKYGGAVVWNKIFKKEILINNNIYFPNSRNEDYYFMFMYSMNSRNIVYLRKCSGYKWYMTEDSLSSGFTYKQTEKLFEMYAELLKVIQKNNVDPNYFFDIKIRKGLISSMCSTDTFTKSNSEIYSLFEKYNSLEEKINNPEKMGIIFDFAKYLLKNKKFFISKIYLKTLTKLNNSQFIHTLMRS